DRGRSLVRSVLRRRPFFSRKTFRALASGRWWLVQTELISEGVEHVHAQTELVFLDAWPQVAIPLGLEFGVVLAYSVRLDVHDRSRSAVAVVLGQMKDQIGARHLHVERQRFLETVLPVNGESQVVDVELLRLGSVEDSKDRDHAPEAH